MADTPHPLLPGNAETPHILSSMDHIDTSQYFVVQISEYDAMKTEIERLRAAGDALVAAIRNHDLQEAHVKAWKEARRG